MNGCYALLSILCICFQFYEPKLFCKDEFLDVTKFNYEQYQDIVINNKVVKKATQGHYHCDLRYQLIKSVLSKYQRPFTMVDLGASQGYYCFRAANDFKQSVFIMVESNNAYYPMVGSQLLSICKANTSLTNVIFLDKIVNAPDVKRLSECESIDVVLAMNILHRMGDHWKEIVDSMIHLGHVVIIETPPPERGAPANHNKMRQDIEAYLIEKKAKIIGQVPRHSSNVMSNMYLIENNERLLDRKTWVMPPVSPSEQTLKICSTFSRKVMFKQRTAPFKTYSAVEWIPGINCLTFKMMSGAYPSKQVIKASIADLEHVQHSDWNINNMVIQGDKVVLIDIGEPVDRSRYSAEVLKLIHGIIDIDSPEEVKKYFWETINQSSVPANS